MSHSCAPLSLRSVVSAGSLLTIWQIAVLTILSPPAFAQGPSSYYTGPVYTGGTSTATHSDGSQISYPYYGTSAYGSGNQSSTSSTAVPNGGTATTATVTLTGAVTATFTWQGTDPAPQSAIVTETDRCQAGCSILPGNGSVSGPCEDGFGQSQTLSPSNPSITETGTRYEIKGGSAPSASWTPNVSLTANSGTSGGANVYGTVSCTATISPVTINLTGPIQDSTGYYNILVGQGCTASLSGIPSGCTVSNYSWSVSGTTLQSWTVYNSTEFGCTAVAISGIGVATNPTVHWYWSDAPGQKTVICTATVTPPTGQGNSFQVTATKTVTLAIPTSALAVHPGRVQINNLTQTTYGTGYALYAGAGNGSSNGIVFTDQVYTPAPFAVGQGSWGFVQIVTPGTFCTPIGGFEENCPPPPATSYNGMMGLDSRVPYAGLFPADNTGHGTVDGPGIAPLSDFYDNYRVNEAYNMYVMYTPPGPDTIAVALTREDWNWQANDANPGSWANWPLIEDAGTIQPTNSVSNPPPPQWSLVVNGVY